MARRKLPDFDCPVCGEVVPGGSKSCPECGACEKSGWSGDSSGDGLFLPEEPGEFDYESFVEEEFGSGGKSRGLGRLYWWVAVILLIVTVWYFFH